jgi:hypothetical protein
VKLHDLYDNMRPERQTKLSRKFVKRFARRHPMAVKYLRWKLITEPEA